MNSVSDNLPASNSCTVIFVYRFAKDFVLPFQKASLIRYFTLEFFFDYNFNFYVFPIHIKYISARTLLHVFYELFLFLCKYLV